MTKTPDDHPVETDDEFYRRALQEEEDAENGIQPQKPAPRPAPDKPQKS